MKPERVDSSTIDQTTALVAPRSATHEAQARIDLLHQFLAYWRGALCALVVVTVLAYFAGRSRASPTLATAWLVLTLANTCAQAAVCLAMERCAASPADLLRWHRWLLISIFLNGIFWGSSPWAVMGAGLEAVWFAALLDMMLMFCIASSPGTWQMVCVANLPVVVLVSAALFRCGVHPLWVIGYAGLVLLIGFYGLRLTATRLLGLVERFAAQALAMELAEKQARLEQQQVRLIEMERERTLLLERQRLMRDMHDGLGASLVTLLSAAQRGLADPGELAALLTECVDDLRSVIDSLEPGDHDLASLLGSMRQRLDRRIQSAGMQLEWKVDDLPPLPWMGATEALQVMRIVQEAVTNSVKHSRAQKVRITAQVCGDCVEVCIADDGQGFDVLAGSSGRGLAFSRQRARGLNSVFDVQSMPAQGCLVRLALPISV